MLMITVLCLALLGMCLGVQSDPAQEENEDEVLYNGIRLESPWPPSRTSIDVDPPPPPPYLVSPPAVIPIDVGQQLFVDDFLIEKTSMKRSFHQAEYHWDNPIIKPDNPWEQYPHPKSAGCAMPFSDGVWYDPVDGLFKMWYMGGYLHSTCYATSEDGIHWDKPELDVVPGTNIVSTHRRDSSLVWLDLEETDPSRRYKMYLNDDPNGVLGSLYLSRDGIQWGDAVAQSGPAPSDRNTFFRNPFRGVWVYSMKCHVDQRRSRAYREHVGYEVAIANEEAEYALDLVPWTGADRLDLRHPDLGEQPQLYNLDAVAYESIMLGLFTIWRGQPETRFLRLRVTREGLRLDP